MKIAFLGDIALYGKFDRTENLDLDDYFQDVKPLLDECDFVVANLEVPFYSNNDNLRYKSVAISSNPINIDILSYLNISIVNISNNHMGDFGLSSVTETVDLLESNNISWFGAKKKTYQLEYENNRIFFSGYCSYNTDGGYVGDKRGPDALKYKEVIKFLEKSNELGAFPVVSVHYGEENVLMPSRDARDFANSVATKFDFFYYGHHPHVINGSEKICNSEVFYSLGNFIFDDVYDKNNNLIVEQNDLNKKSIIVILELQDSKLLNKEVVGIQLTEKKMLINCDEAESLFNTCCELLKLDLTSYLSKRKEMIKKATEKLHSRRNLDYYISRLSAYTIFRVFSRKINRLKHNLYFRMYIRDK